MPYDRELSNKASHRDIVQNPDVAEFLKGCDYLTPPSDAEGEAIGARFGVAPSGPGRLPDSVVAIDGSYYETCLSDKLPNTRVGFVKVGALLIRMAEYGGLRVEDQRYVDPFRVADMRRHNSALTFPLPSANVRTKGRASVRDSFRAAVDYHLDAPATRFDPADPATSLRATLFRLAALRPNSDGDPARLRLHKCPSCGVGPVEVADRIGPQSCPHCGAEVFPADCLRVWEEVKDYQANGESIARFMMAVEHMMPAHYVRYLADTAPASLSGLVFFVDGPLAVFGNAAWLHASVMRLLADVNARLRHQGHAPVVVIGLQKTGLLADHFALIDKYVPPGRLLAVSDDYRAEYVVGDGELSANGFGSETYYGQDFLYKTPTGRRFVLGLAYPLRAKLGADSGVTDFAAAKVEVARYADLPLALELIRHFECDLYANSVVPVALAHRYTSISLAPGGRVLDLLARRALSGEVEGAPR